MGRRGLDPRPARAGDAAPPRAYTIVGDGLVEPVVVAAGAGGPDPLLGTIAGATFHRYGLTDAVQFAFDIVDFCAADVDGNDDVNVDDLVAVILEWGATSSVADVDRNGMVNVDDLLAVILSWGRDCSETPAEACSYHDPCGGGGT